MEDKESIAQAADILRRGGLLAIPTETVYGIATRPGAHCAPLMHQSLGTVEQGIVRFSFSWFNTEEEVETAVRAVKELAED